ncbi:MFS family permease [Azospirillum sp. OGB3]|uniref:arabinose transporter n=1 Tax=Azospirillum sp. OGB3 TaxID=2587012 RepID=UPI001605EB63|nr:arabinose transporter [Azospirillum sp. OGB3]MBB3266845.1 MFS family permease [Azospirillum sp. OGB3]
MGPQTRPDQRPVSARDAAQGRLIVLTAVLFVSYLCVALSLPVVPLFVAGDLGMGNVWAGLGVGSAFLATILSRGFAGTFSDRQGAKRAVGRGLGFYVVGGLVSMAAGPLSFSPWAAFSVLVAGRLLIGVGESLVGVGVVAWGIGIVGPQRSGRVLALIGAALYGAFAAGGPLGLALLDRFGFSGVMAVSALLPALGLLAIRCMEGPPAHPDAERPPFRSVLGRIWRQGAVVSLQGIGFAAIGAFFSLHFVREGWPYAGLGLTAFGLGFVLVRFALGHLPDRVGGLRVAMGSLAVEAVGQALLWSAGDPVTALAGAFLTGLGCSLVFPAMGREVVHLVEPQLRGTALGAFAAFQDVAYGLTGPLAGLLADRVGYGGVFLLGSVAAVLGFLTTVQLLRARPVVKTSPT